MKTASWFTYRGPGRIGISRGTPRAMPAGYKLYKPLFPTASMLKIEDRAEYEPLYRAILADLDPQRVLDELLQLTGGAEPVLLCWEKPPFSEKNFCHRRMVADWMGETLGLDVPEFGQPTPAVLF